jgi:hypothetical protein
MGKSAIAQSPQGQDQPGGGQKKTKPSTASKTKTTTTKRNLTTINDVHVQVIRSYPSLHSLRIAGKKFRNAVADTAASVRALKNNPLAKALRAADFEDLINTVADVDVDVPSSHYKKKSWVLRGAPFHHIRFGYGCSWPKHPKTTAERRAEKVRSITLTLHTDSQEDSAAESIILRFEHRENWMSNKRPIFDLHQRYRGVDIDVDAWVVNLFRLMIHAIMRSAYKKYFLKAPHGYGLRINTSGPYHWQHFHLMLEDELVLQGFMSERSALYKDIQTSLEEQVRKDGKRVTG